MATPVLQFKRGAFTQLPALKAGEPGFTTDKFDLFIGLDNVLANNKFVGSHRYWTQETSSVGSGVNLVEGSSNGSDFITLRSPGSLSGIVTYVMPGVQGGTQTVLTNDGSGNLSWSSGSLNAVFTGITTVNGTFLDVNVNSDFSGITTFSNTTDNTLGDADTGAVQIDGGLGVNKNVTVGANLHVQGFSNFVGVVTFRGGTINLGDADTDDINVAGEFISNLIPNVDDSFDIGQGTDPKRWRHANFSGVGTFATGAVADAIQIGITGASEIDTSSGDLTLDSTGGTVIVDDQLSVTGVSTFTGVIDANGGATIDNIQIGITDNNEIDTSSGGLTLDSSSGQTTIDDNLSVTGVSTFTGATTFTGAIDANGGATIDNIQIGVTGDNEIDTSTGNLTLDSAGGFTTIDDALTVTGVSTFSSATTFTGAIDANGGATIDNIQIGVTGDNEIDTSTGNLTIDSAGGLTTIDDNLIVSGVSTFTGVIDANGGLTVTGVSTFSSAIDANGGLDVSGGETTLSSATVSDLTSGRVVLAGTSGALEDSLNLTFDGSTLTVGTTVDATNLEVSNIKAKDGTASITIADTTGVVAISTNLTVQGDLFVTGSRTEVNTETLLVEDQLIEVGLVDNGSGSLIAPSTDTAYDVGILFHYFDTSAKKAALFWDDSTSRVAVASSVTESASNVMENIIYAGFEVGALWVNDCAGQSQVISCTGSERNLENITIDCGTFT